MNKKTDDKLEDINNELMQDHNLFIEKNNETLILQDFNKETHEFTIIKKFNIYSDLSTTIDLIYVLINQVIARG